MEWSKFHRLVDDTVSRLRNAEGDRQKVESVIRRYLNQGYKYVTSPYILCETRRLQGRSVLGYLYEALVAHRKGIPVPSLLTAQ